MGLESLSSAQIRVFLGAIALRLCIDGSGLGVDSWRH